MDLPPTMLLSPNSQATLRVTGCRSMNPAHGFDAGCVRKTIPRAERVYPRALGRGAPDGHMSRQCRDCPCQKRSIHGGRTRVILNYETG